MSKIRERENRDIMTQKFFKGLVGILWLECKCSLRKSVLVERSDLL